MVNDPELSGRNDAAANAYECPKVTLTLARVLNGFGFQKWTVERFAASCPSFRWNLTYARDEPLDEVFRSDLVESLVDYLPQTEDPHVLTAFDFMLDLPEIVLSRLTVTGLEICKGIQRVRVSFQRVMGDLRGLFLPNRVPDIMKEAHNVVSTRVLIEMLVPILNLIETAPDASTDLSHRQLNAFLRGLKARHHDLAFYLTLMTRYVANTNRQVPDVPVAVAVSRPQGNNDVYTLPLARAG